MSPMPSLGTAEVGGGLCTMVLGDGDATLGIQQAARRPS